ACCVRAAASSCSSSRTRRVRHSPGCIRGTSITSPRPWPRSSAGIVRPTATCRDRCGRSPSPTASRRCSATRDSAASDSSGWPSGSPPSTSPRSRLRSVDFDLPEELLLLRRTVREFVEGRLQPLERQIEHDDKIPDDVLREMGALGFFGLPFPEEYGGAGAGDLGYCVALEEFARTSAAFSNLVGAHTSIGSMSIYLGGTDPQTRQHLPDLTASRKTA